jgi:hypothetical protein
MTHMLRGRAHIKPIILCRQWQCRGWGSGKIWLGMQTSSVKQLQVRQAQSWLETPSGAQIILLAPRGSIAAHCLVQSVYMHHSMACCFPPDCRGNPTRDQHRERCTSSSNSSSQLFACSCTSAEWFACASRSFRSRGQSLGSCSSRLQLQQHTS